MRFARKLLPVLALAAVPLTSCSWWDEIRCWGGQGAGTVHADDQAHGYCYNLNGGGGSFAPGGTGIVFSDSGGTGGGAGGAR